MMFVPPQEREKPKMPPSWTRMELNCIHRYLRSLDGINAVTRARNTGNHMVDVMLDDGTTTTVSWIHFYNLHGDEVWFDQYDKKTSTRLFVPKSTSRLFVPKYETDADRTEEMMIDILSFLAYVMATTTRGATIRHYIQEADKIIISNLSDYLPDLRCKQWLQFKNDIYGTILKN